MKRPKVGDTLTLPNNTIATITEIKPRTNQWGVDIGGFECWGVIVSSDSNIVGERHLLLTCKN